MKKLILAVALNILMNSVSYAQMKMLDNKPASVTVGKLSISGITRTKLSYEPSADTIYTWLYRNEDYRSPNEYKSIKFSGKGNTVDLLYNTLKDFWSEENKTKASKEVRKTFALGETEVTVDNLRMFGRTQIFVHMPEGSFSLFEKDLNILFGKTK